MRGAGERGAAVAGVPCAKAHTPRQHSAGWRPTHRHVARGTEYEVLGMGAVQTEKPLTDMDVVVIYRAADGMLWARNRAEFFDGRFAPLPADHSPSVLDGEAGLIPLTVQDV